MLYSFPVSPSIMFGAPYRVGITRYGILLRVRNNKNKKKILMHWLSFGKPQKNENNNN